MTAQPTNPLIAARKPVVSRDIDQFCAWCNGLSWVRASGAPYFVNTRTGPNGIERFLDRKA